MGLVLKIIKWILLTLLAATLLIALSYGCLKITGKDQKVLTAGVAYLLKPSEPFHEDNMSEAPDYAKEANWLTLPFREDEADLVPTGLAKSNNDGSAPVDVFYIHGTGFINNSRWTSPIRNGTATEDNAKFSLANQASIFNGCCNIYAPHFREASIFAYIALNGDARDRLLDAVYIDISNAFDYYLKKYNNNRPFIIVSHSQGAHLAMRLLREIDASPTIAEKLVVGFLVGSGPVSLTQKFLNSLQHFDVCKNATDIHCVVHWNTYGENGGEKIFSSPEPSICVNPLSWRSDGARAAAELNLGSVPISGAYTMRVAGDDYSDKVAFNSPGAPMPRYTWAQCRDGFLYVADQSGTEYEKLGKQPDKFYHGLDFPLFHMNIRDNVSVRIDSYFNSQSR